MSGGTEDEMMPEAGREFEPGWGRDSKPGFEAGFDQWLSGEVSLSTYGAPYGGTESEVVEAGVWVQVYSHLQEDGFCQEDRMPEALRDRIMRGLPEGVYPAGPWYMRVVRVGVTWYHRFFRR